jgi:hypothetical protein
MGKGRRLNRRGHNCVRLLRCLLGKKTEGNLHALLDRQEVKASTSAKVFLYNALDGAVLRSPETNEI